MQPTNALINMEQFWSESPRISIGYKINFSFWISTLNLNQPGFEVGVYQNIKSVELKTIIPDQQKLEKAFETDISSQRGWYVPMWDFIFQKYKYKYKYRIQNTKL